MRTYATGNKISFLGEYNEPPIHIKLETLKNLNLQEINISWDDAFERIKKQTKLRIEEEKKYRTKILGKIKVFAGFGEEALIAAALSLEEIVYKRGDTIIAQGDIGDSFYILEDGLLSVTLKDGSNDIPREINVLKNDAYFGEISLLTVSPRTASVTVISNEAKCLRMKKELWDDLMKTPRKILKESKENIIKILCHHVINQIPLFEHFQYSQKQKLLDEMIPIHYSPNEYICKQGVIGNSFFIITNGNCKVTVTYTNERDEIEEREVQILNVGDFFGEQTLTDKSHRRNQNVIALEPVICLTLTRKNFTTFVNKLRMRNILGIETGNFKRNALYAKRRVSSLNTHGQIDEGRLISLTRRFFKFTTESLWLSLYSRLYRRVIMDPSKLTDYGPILSEIVKSDCNRYDSVSEIRRKALISCDKDWLQKSEAESNLLYSLFSQRNILYDKICKDWPILHFKSLCKSIKIETIPMFTKLSMSGSRGTAAFLIVRGAIRIFVQSSISSQPFYEEDLMAGDMFGEEVLLGNNPKIFTAITITNVDLGIIQFDDFFKAQSRDANAQLNLREKEVFLQSGYLLKSWDTNTLNLIALELQQKEIFRGTDITNYIQKHRGLYFILHGKVDVCNNKTDKLLLSSLSRFDYFGETFLINNSRKDSNEKPIEESLYHVSTTKLDVLFLTEHQFSLFSKVQVDVFREAFIQRNESRLQRLENLLTEKEQIHKVSGAAKVRREKALSLPSPENTKLPRRVITRREKSLSLPSLEAKSGLRLRPSTQSASLFSYDTSPSMSYSTIVENNKNFISLISDNKTTRTSILRSQNLIDKVNINKSINKSIYDEIEEKNNDKRNFKSSRNITFPVIQSLKPYDVRKRNATVEHKDYSPIVISLKPKTNQTVMNLKNDYVNDDFNNEINSFLENFRSF